MRTTIAILLATLLAACGRGGEAGKPSTQGSATDRIASTRGTAQAPREATAPPAVRMPAPEALTDGAITGRVRSALVGDPAMGGADVSVNTDKGVVVLSGSVISHEQTALASAHAQRQDGVLRVDNHLRPAFS